MADGKGGNLQIVLSAKDQTAAGFASAQRNAKKLEDGLAGVQKSADAFMGKLKGAAAAFGIALGLAEAVQFARQVMHMGAAINDLAAQLGIGAQALQAYQAVAASTGVKSEEMGKALTELSKKMGEAAGGNKEAIESFQQLGIKLLDSRGKVRPLTDIMTEAAAAIDGLGSQSQKTAAAQKLFGEAGAKLLPVLSQMSQGIDPLTARMQAMGLVMDDDVIKTLKEWDATVAKLELQWKVAFATFMTQTVPAVIGEIVDAFKALLAVIDQAKKSWDLFWAGLTSARYEPKDQADQIRWLESGIAFYREQAARADNPRARAAWLEQVEVSERRIAEIRAAGLAAAPRGALPVEAPPPAQKPVPGGRVGGVLTEPQFDPRVPKVTTTGARDPAVKGAGEDIGKQIEKLRLEAEDALRVLERMRSDTATPWPEWQKQMDSMFRVEKQISDFRAQNKLSESDPVAKRFAEQARATEAAKQKLDQYKMAAADADRAERQYGDGKMQLAEATAHLDRAFATGRLSLEAYTVATQQAQETQKRQQLEMIGIADKGWGGFVAGARLAQMEWEKANDAFAQGQRFFENTMASMTSALEEFVNTGKINFRGLANSIIADLIRMQLKAASTSIFGALGSLFGLIGGPDTDAARVPGRAAGGPVEAGMAYVVGEKRPELFIPDRSGTILPDIGALSSSRGGGITIHNTFVVQGGDEAGVYRALNRMMPEMERRMLDRVMDARQRGGRFGAAFRA